MALPRYGGRLLLPREIAPFLKVSERWVQDKMNKGTFPIRWYYISEKIRGVDSEDLNDFLNKIRVEAGSAYLPTGAIKKIAKEEVKA